MKMLWRVLFVSIGGLMLLHLSCVSGQADPATTKAVDANCVDHSKEPPDVLDCSKDEYAKEGRTKCCKQDAAVGCCKPDGSWQEFMWIGIGIGIATITLIIVVFSCMWCKEETFPCVGVCRRKMKECCDCCDSKVKPAKEEDFMPEEFKHQEVDDFWGDRMTTVD